MFSLSFGYALVGKPSAVLYGEISIYLMAPDIGSGGNPENAAYLTKGAKAL